MNENTMGSKNLRPEKNILNISILHIFITNGMVQMVAKKKKKKSRLVSDFGHLCDKKKQIKNHITMLIC